MANRILTTHTGSLARPAELRDMLGALAKRQAVDRAAFDALSARAVADIVQAQCDIGLDIINDGEQAKVGFAQYVRVRMTGFEGEPIRRQASLEEREFPEAAGQVKMQIPCTGPLAWTDFDAVLADIANLKAATAGLADRQVFMNSVSPGSFVNNNPNRYYATREAYRQAIVDAMRREYEAIAAAGFIVQLDSPDLAQRSYNFPDLSLAEFRQVVAENIEALNEATRNIPQEQLRVHVCWGAGEDPHNHDTELRQIVDLLMTLRVGGVSFVCGNGRHAHEWRVWERVKVPDGMQIIQGVIDSTTNIIEHPELVCERLINLAGVLGPDRIIAGVDCGFATGGVMAPVVHPKVAAAKLRSLVEGTRMANRRLGLA